MTELAIPPRHVARWAAIGCTVHVETRRAADLAPTRRLVAALVRDLDEVASRFRADSDLSRVNRAPGRWTRVDPMLAAAVRVALAAAEGSGGLVHPLLGRQLVELGYDRTFRALREVTGVPSAPAPWAPPLDAWREVGVSADAVRIPVDTALDLGATAKAWATDLAVTALESLLDDTAVVSIGGDLRTVGGAWDVAVSERPDAPAETTVRLSGALATSSTQVRRWRRAGVVHHHVIDPRTGRPAHEVWRTVSAAAPTCVAANTASTAGIVLGADAIGHLTATVPAARLVDTTGTVHTLGAWPDETQPEDRR